ncbi:MAG: flagellar hook-basal body complex protein FliE [Gammaproteobacteria bacterium]
MTTITPDMLLARMRMMSSQAQGLSIKSTETTSKSQEAGFSDLLKQSINEVNTQQADAKNLAIAFEQGDKNIELSEVMISMQKANVSFQAMLEVRNKLVGAYQDIMNMQV